MDSFNPNLTSNELAAESFGAQMVVDMHSLEFAIQTGTNREIFGLLKDIKEKYGIDNPSASVRASAKKTLEDLGKGVTNQLESFDTVLTTAQNRNLTVAHDTLELKKDTMSIEEYNLRKAYGQALSERTSLQREQRDYLVDHNHATAAEVQKDIDAVNKRLSQLRKDLKPYNAKHTRKHLPVELRQDLLQGTHAKPGISPKQPPVPVIRT